MAKRSANVDRTGTGESNPSAKSIGAISVTPDQHYGKLVEASNPPTLQFIKQLSDSEFIAVCVRPVLYGAEISYIDQISVSNLGLVGREAQDLQQIGLANTIRSLISHGSGAIGVPCFDATFNAAKFYYSR